MPEENIEQTDEIIETDEVAVTDAQISEPPADDAEIDFDQFTDEELTAIEANGGVIPDEILARFESVPDETAADETDAPDGEEAKETAPEPVTEFRFTENADDETFKRETDEFLQRFEDTPELEQLKTIVEGYQKRYETASETAKAFEGLGDIEQVRKIQSALDETVSKSRQDEETGVFVPDTSSFRKVMRENYPNEYVQVLQDELGAQSEKYRAADGTPYSLMEELVADGFGFTDPKKRQNLEYFLRTGGETQIPPFIPDGINETVAEAYWKSIDRTEIEEKLNQYRATLNDDTAYDDEKAEAQRGIDAINQRLAQVQNGLNSDRAKQTEQQKKNQADREAFESKVMANCENTAITLEREFADKISSKLSMFGEGSKGAKITGRSYATLVRDALSENQSFANAARTDLKELGINFDWQKGYDALDRLYRKEREITFKENNPNINPRSIDISKREKADILREIKAQETELFGKIMAVVQADANTALTKKAAVPPVKKARLVMRGAAASATVNGGDRFAAMSDKELAIYAEAEELMKKQGIIK